MSKAWVVGEVLVDLIPSHDGDERVGDERYRAVIGGGAANTARALARLGNSCEFIGGLSSDRFGHMAWMELERDGVGLDLIDESDLPTAKAIVSIGEDGSASYRFEVADSATFSFNQRWLPNGAPDVVHVGTLASIIDPGREELLSWVREKKDSRAVVVYDPNVRPAFLGDRDHYRRMVEAWVALSSLVKASDEDLQWLYPELDAESVAAQWMGFGVELVVITRGAHGIVGMRKEERVEVPGVAIDLVDTVGAGDTVGAVLVEGIIESRFEGLRGERLEMILHRAACAAAMTCSRQGANPPTSDELDVFMEKSEVK